MGVLSCFSCGAKYDPNVSGNVCPRCGNTPGEGFLKRKEARKVGERYISGE